MANRLSTDPLNTVLQKANIGLQWLLTRKGDGSWNHFDANMFVRASKELTEPDIQVQMIPIVADRTEAGFSSDHGVTFLVCLLAQKSRGTVKIKSADTARQPLPSSPESRLSS